MSKFPSSQPSWGREGGKNNTVNIEKIAPGPHTKIIHFLRLFFTFYSSFPTLAYACASGIKCFLGFVSG